MQTINEHFVIIFINWTYIITSNTTTDMGKRLRLIINE